MRNPDINEAGDQSTLIASLLKLRAYPHPVSSIELLETHISWVILTGSIAYKIKKAVRLDFLDFGSLKRRRHFCEEELRLNRQWAPELYLEVLPIGGSIESPVIGGGGEAVEYALKMVQFPQSAQLDKQLAAGLLRENDMRELAETIAGYHERAKTIEYANDSEAVMKVRAPMLDNFTPLSEVIDMDVLERVRDWTSEQLSELKPTLIARRQDGFVRECHGDLHLANLVRLPTGIVAFDCVEFSAELRNIDVISDVAFLVMDLVAGARQDLAYTLLNRYLERTGDYAGMAVLSLYFVYHCMIRAKVAAIRSAERTEDEGREKDIDRLKHNLAVAARWIDDDKPLLIATHGYSGSGKTWLSSQLMSQLPAIRVRSDVERKRLVGLDEAASSGSAPGQGLYSETSKAEVYEHLMRLAGYLLDAGFNVIVDASFLHASDRQALVALAESHAVPYAFVDTSAEKEELVKRLQKRTAGSGDISEADVAVLDFQYSHSDSLNTLEREHTVFVPTGEDVDLRHVIRGIRRVCG